ncbi:hypothetical protein VMCG_07983 [Cytospora schulzeri]|uniref:Uncharacterized protein n=1 Tax=Cytospora schulzeri TaxID=448051 RepID=A0A423VYD0_9PEZI|nr:hypothetical protein VMCG_07983 [Valsa malicola]
MAPQFSSEEIQEHREADLTAQRVQALGWAFTSVPQKSARGDEHTKRRVEKLGHAFTHVPMNINHQDWVSMSKDEQEAYRAKMQAIANEDIDGLRTKWSWLRSPNGGDWLAVEVIEDSGSTTDFISRSQIKHLKLEAEIDDPILLRTITGQIFTVNEYVEVLWSGKDLKERRGRFWVAPTETPIQMLVGRNFTKEYPEVLMDERPESSPQGMLLTMQVKMEYHFWETQLPPSLEYEINFPIITTVYESLSNLELGSSHMATNESLDFLEAEYDRNRVLKAGYVHGGVPMSSSHDSFLKHFKGASAVGGRIESLGSVVQPPPLSSLSTAFQPLSHVPAWNTVCPPQNETLNHIVQEHMSQARPPHFQPQLRPSYPAMGLPAPTIQVSISWPYHCYFGTVPNGIPCTTDEFPLPSSAAASAQSPGRILGPVHDGSSSPVAGSQRKPHGGDDKQFPRKKWAMLYSPSSKGFISVMASLDHNSPANWISEKLLHKWSVNFTTVKHTSYDSPQGYRLESSRTIKADWRGSSGKTYNNEFLVFADGAEAVSDLIMGHAILRKLGEIGFLSRRPDNTEDQSRHHDMKEIIAERKGYRKIRGSQSSLAAQGGRGIVKRTDSALHRSSAKRTGWVSEAIRPTDKQAGDLNLN